MHVGQPPIPSLCGKTQRLGYNTAFGVHACRLDPFPFSAGIRIVEPAIHSLGEEAEGTRPKSAREGIYSPAPKGCRTRIDSHSRSDNDENYFKSSAASSADCLCRFGRGGVFTSSGATRFQQGGNQNHQDRQQLL